jgi:hypothetical protein
MPALSIRDRGSENELTVQTAHCQGDLNLHWIFSRRKLSWESQLKHLIRSFANRDIESASLEREPPRSDTRFSVRGAESRTPNLDGRQTGSGTVGLIGVV